jgi:hypothetical protein
MMVLVGSRRTIPPTAERIVVRLSVFVDESSMAALVRIRTSFGSFLEDHSHFTLGKTRRRFGNRIRPKNR